MRKEVLGLLACVASGSMAFAQYMPGTYGPAPGEPVPVQSPMYPSASFGAYPSVFPSYSPPNWREPAEPLGYGMSAPTPQPMAYPAPPYGPMPMVAGYPPLPVGPTYGPPLPPSAPFGATAGAQPAPGSPGAPPAAPAPAGQAPSPNALSAPAAPGSGPTGPTEPYLFSAPMGGGGHSEPYFQQVDPWRSVRASNVYGYLDYICWWTSRPNVPSVTTLPGVDVGGQISSLYNNDPRSGVRATFGEWITPMKNLGWEVSGFYLGDQVSRNILALPGAPPSATTLPFFFGINSQGSQVVETSHLWGAETNLRYQFCCFRTDPVQWFFDFTGGFRYLDLSEGIGVQTASEFATAPVLLSGATLTSTDNFFTHNNFYGGQIGGEANIYFWRFNVSLYGKVAFGDNFETVNVSGFTTAVSPVTTSLLQGGFLTAPSNIGHHTSNVFAVVPEAGVNIGFRVCQYCQLGVGYTFLYFSRVVRPADQIPTGTGGTVLPPSITGVGTSPAFNLQESHFFANGLNARIMFIF